MSITVSWSIEDYYLFLSSVPVIGARRFAKIIKQFPTAASFLVADRQQLIGSGISDAVADELLAARPTTDIAALWRQVHQEDVTLLRHTDETYPPLLRQIYDWPPLLYHRGTVRADRPLVAVVGSRQPTSYGEQATAEIVTGLVAAGIGIVSGVARGIDQAAHRAALAAGGYTIGVLGTGLDRASAGNAAKQSLMATMVANGGAVISEFPFGTPGSKFTFPLRNRLISGMSSAVVVVEAAAKSGALITAQSALDQNRVVLAVPGSIFSPTSVGCHQLIYQGAVMATNAADILSELGWASAPAAPPAAPPELTGDAQIIWRTLSAAPCHIDRLIWQTGLASDTVNALLVQLELANLIRHLGGRQYIRL
ncbi:MAG: DNA-processing protein DprA [Patescibacteria group bacterium]